MDSSGKRATKTGKSFEKFIQNRLSENGYEFIDIDHFIPATYNEQSIYTKQLIIGKSIYGKDLKVDYVIYHPEKHPNCLIIESKWQQIKGSTDKKFPYIVMNIKQKYPYPAIVVLGGKGFKPEAENWLKNQVGGNLKHVFDMVEFHTWVNNGGI